MASSNGSPKTGKLVSPNEVEDPALSSYIKEVKREKQEWKAYVNDLSAKRKELVRSAGEGPKLCTENNFNFLEHLNDKEIDLYERVKQAIKIKQSLSELHETVDFIGADLYLQRRRLAEFLHVRPLKSSIYKDTIHTSKTSGQSNTEAEGWAMVEDRMAAWVMDDRVYIGFFKVMQLVNMLVGTFVHNSRIFSTMVEEVLSFEAARCLFARFKKGEFKLDDEPHAGRPVEVDVESLQRHIEQDPRLMTRYHFRKKK